MDGIERLKENLNEQQLAAVMETEGYVRVIAGAGSGKTKALTNRYAYIVEALGINSSSILCVTFTNKAAQEMRKRVKRLIGENSDLSYITTYHGFCVRVLREDINKIQYPKNFVIMDVEDQKTVLRQVYNELGLTSKVFTFKQVLRYISKQKTSQEYLQYILDSKKKETDNEIEKVFIRYLEKQQRNFALDFDDLINFTLYIFSNNSEVLEKWQKRLHYIQVDETQDSSQKQFMLIEMLSQLHKNLFVVGDPDQTIYEWRGAKPEILVDFDKQFVDSKTIIMNQNYRSTPNILSLGNHIIKNNKIRVDKDMFTQNPEGVEVVHFHGKNDYEEGLWVANEIKRLVKDEGCKHSDFAILYRANHISRSIEQSLIRENISYSVFGGIRFFERKEIKDVLSYLRLIEFEDDFSFLRVINRPNRGLGKKFIENVAKIAEKENVSLYTALKENISEKDLKRKGAIDFIELVEKFKRTKVDLIISDLVKEIMDESGLSAYYRTDGDTDRLDNIKEFQNSIILLESQDEEPINLTEYLQEIALYTDMDIDDDKNDRVKLMTIHTSKGLEFPYVFLCGFTEGVLPSAMSIKERRAKALEEERRLTYVAITRAEKAFYLTESEGFNLSTGLSKYPSRFLFEISESYFVRKGELSQEIIKEAKEQLVLNAKRQLIQKRFEVGDIVKHAIWNEGKIIEVNESKGEYTIEFKEATKPITFEFKGLSKIVENITQNKENQKSQKQVGFSLLTDEKREAYIERAAAILRKKHGIEEDLRDNEEAIFIEEKNKEVKKLENEPAADKEKKLDKKVHAKIRRFAKKEYPLDKEMQDHVYKNQVLAFLFMETVTDKELEKYAIKQYKNDFCMQQHIYDKSILAKNYMASVKDKEIKNIALKSFPLDYDMQQYVYDKQIDAKLKMSKFADSDYRKKAISQFPEDYVMQIYIYEKLISERVEDELNVIAKEAHLKDESSNRASNLIEEKNDTKSVEKVKTESKLDAKTVSKEKETFDMSETKKRTTSTQTNKAESGNSTKPKEKDNLWSKFKGFWS
ncbi:ATP-dependent helicase [Arenibacter sp. ARW7G5Y1]|uniref:ATP-dependent helicase n=1 Tax=Arenibacter sp. ARW7G5Y1 TaxID=2135619 RepID=UPI000D774E30|nr:UvrD-helicase domain-containing protein [Arenibacter sp. ARW7G5Y1]PXX25675.1 DNA helicase-2/ATP-dependent DNA helicase PcrA [Arenibacter sp. ARW7G5Y1]